MTSFDILTIVFVFLPAVVLHEYAHGWVAYRLGDPTAKQLGRLSLNPLKHIDPVGSVLFPVVLHLVGSPVLLGWAKPVPVNFMNLRNPRRHMVWVGLAGPAINMLMAVSLSLFLRLALPPIILQLITGAVFINLVLAVFNLIPIPPLDGSRLVMGFLPPKYAHFFGKLEGYGMVLVFVLLYFGFLREVIWPVVRSLASLLGVDVSSML